ncbi:MAG: hypothetical protein KIS85_09960 [Anaerolineales bacterium]|nr:hypothetical protein [Anaerolineales bacterium]
MTAKQRTHILIGLALAAALLLGACRAPQPEPHAPPTQDLNALYTQVAGTLIAQGQQGGEPAPEEPTQTPIVVTATYTDTPEIVETATPTNTSVPPTPVAVCNQAAFVADITIPDNSQIGRGNTFTKTWRIRNTGTCTWDKDDYDVVFESGTNLANNNTFDLPKDVAPGETVDISIPMRAPQDNGTYRSSWMIRSGSGVKFGVNGSGGSAGVPFFALIRVGSGSSGGGNLGYDFASNFCDAQWSSGTKNNLPCPGANQGADGFVLVLQNPELEHRNEDEPAIWMRPNHAGSGYIRGEFPKYEVRNNDYFVALIGCFKNNPNCRLTFKLSAIRPNGNEVVLGTWDERFDNLSHTVNVNLSSLAGTEVRFVLTVEAGNQNYGQANGYWFLPQIVRK